MAGWFEVLRFRAPVAGGRADAWPVALLQGISAFALGRLSERAVCRLTWPFALGMAASEWEASGVEPFGLGLSCSDLAVVESDHDSGIGWREALRIWTPSPWTGLVIDYEVPPGASGFPEIYGTCWWYVWWFRDRWHTKALLEYPSSVVGRDERCAVWLASLRTEASTALDLEVVENDRAC